MRKLTFEEVKSKFTEAGWQLLSTDYKGSQVNLSVICPEGHTTTISWNNFQRGQGCKHCAGNVKYDLEYVKSVFEDRGCELLEMVYLNNMQPLKFLCQCGDIAEMRFADFLRGRYCQKCKGKKCSERQRMSDEDIAKFCEQQGCQFVRSWSKCRKTRIEYVCKCGDLNEAYWTNFRRFPNCKKCGAKKISGDKCHMWNPDRERVALNKRFQKTCGRLLRRALLATGQAKSDHTYKMLGYTAQELQDHILKHPNYPSCKDDFHIDHIFPVQAFLDYGIRDLTLINRLDNLRPLFGPENISKADTYDEARFKEWLSKQ